MSPEFLQIRHSLWTTYVNTLFYTIRLFNGVKRNSDFLNEGSCPFVEYKKCEPILVESSDDCDSVRVMVWWENRFGRITRGRKSCVKESVIDYQNVCNHGHEFDHFCVKNHGREAQRKCWNKVDRRNGVFREWIYEGTQHAWAPRHPFNCHVWILYSANTPWNCISKCYMKLKY